MTLSFSLLIMVNRLAKYMPRLGATLQKNKSSGFIDINIHVDVGYAGTLLIGTFPFIKNRAFI